MTQASEHLSNGVVHAYVDGELAGAEQETVREHLSGCSTCSIRVLSTTQLKTATARAGQRYPVPAATLGRLSAQVLQMPAPRGQRTSTKRPWIWSGLAAALLLAVSLAGWRQIHQTNSLSSELLDQHLGSLSSGATPQVISSDRHTVKPWFQGRVPFSFNLPEPQALPGDTVLRGADLTYLEGKPAALLLFTVHKHHVSVFLTQRSNGVNAIGLAGIRSGFDIQTATTRDLQLIAVSDVNPADLSALLAVLVQAQTPA
jgi:anti-sigma factor RsiW